MMAEKCPACGVGEIEKESFLTTIDMGVVKVDYEEWEEYCNSCGSVLLTLNTQKQNIKNKNEALRISGVC